MIDPNSDIKRPIKNQLFNANVTGGTFEDFSQNAVLFPAQALPPTVSTNTSKETSPASTPQATIVQENSSPIVFQEPKLPAPEHQENKSQLSSVFSSFSNILTFKPTQNPNLLSHTDPQTTQFETVIGENTEPVPLISTKVGSVDGGYLQPHSSIQPVLEPPTVLPQGATNNFYRRSGLKKPTYAQVPGLVSSRSPSLDQPSTLTSSHPVAWPNIQSGQTQDQNCTQAIFPPTYTDRFSPISKLPLVTNSPTPNLPFLTTPSGKKPETSNILQPVLPADLPTSSTLFNPPIPQATTADLHPTNQTSPVLNPVQSVPLTTVTSSSSISAFPPIASFHFSHTSEPLHSASLGKTPFLPASSVFHNPATSSGVPLFSPSDFTPSYISSPVMAAVPESEVQSFSNGMASPNPLASAYGNQNGPQSASSTIYRPVYHHWFFKKVVEGKTLWHPFSMVDSLALEEAFTSSNMSPEKVVATDGGRYDVNILRRERYPVYWKAESTEVRRCSWFYKAANDGRFVPYEENIATMLENEFRTAYETKEWHRKVELPNGETVAFHGPDVLVLFPPPNSPDAWGNTPQTQPKPRVVKRGLDEFDIEDGESTKVDHLLFVVHGIGSVCDLKFRSVEEVVDEFRSIALQLINSHYRSSCDSGITNRIEVLPVSWHSKLHSEDTGVDQNLKNITLESIPRLRDFTNDTLLDILFYTSPIYSQTIITTVGTELNRLYELFKHRNPTFNGCVSLSGHSLGSLILFDLLSHQKTPEPEKEKRVNTGEDVLSPLKKPHPKDRRLTRRISYMMSEAGTGQPELQYPHLHFHPIAFFALGSPIGMFITVRGLDKLGDDFALPTCPGFFNIFHPYDPVAYRVESLINPELAKLKPVLIPHHKGRKRMHLELKETMTRVGADLKQKVVDSMKNTWNTFFQIALFGKQENSVSLEVEVDKVLEQHLADEEIKDVVEPPQGPSIEEQKTNLYLGMLNKGRRIDYVLQEAPFEFFNEYLFALTSHVGYWESEDTILLILKEIYNHVGINSDIQTPQQTLTIERPSSSPRPLTPVSNPSASTSKQIPAMGMDPTVPMTSKATVGPPPTSGFVRKT